MIFFLIHDHMGLEILGRFSPYNFHLMSAKLYENIWISWWNTGYHFSWQSAKFKKKCETLKF